MRSMGIKASDLIRRLEILIEQHGDQEVFKSGSDYPGGVTGVEVRRTGDGYIPTGVFVIHGGI